MKKSNIDAESKYFSQIMKAIDSPVSNYVFLGILLGIVFGTIGFGIIGMVFNFGLLVISIMIISRAKKCKENNNKDINLFGYSTALITIIALEINNTGFAIFNLTQTIDKPFLSINHYFLILFIVYIILMLSSFLIVFIVSRIIFNPSKYQLDKFETGKFAIIGSVGAGSAGLIGYNISHLIKSDSIQLSIIVILLFIADYAIFSYVSLYILMYRYLKISKNLDIKS